MSRPSWGPGNLKHNLLKPDSRTVKDLQFVCCFLFLSLFPYSFHEQARQRASPSPPKGLFTVNQPEPGPGHGHSHIHVLEVFGEVLGTWHLPMRLCLTELCVLPLCHHWIPIQSLLFCDQTEIGPCGWRCAKGREKMERVWAQGSSGCFLGVQRPVSCLP